MMNVFKKGCIIAGALTLALLGTAQADLVGVNDKFTLSMGPYQLDTGGNFQGRLKLLM